MADSALAKSCDASKFAAFAGEMKRRLMKYISYSTLKSASFSIYSQSVRQLKTGDKKAEDELHRSLVAKAMMKDQKSIVSL
jgi:hypothetical protein